MAEISIEKFSGIEIISRKKFVSDLGSFSVTYQQGQTPKSNFFQDSISILKSANTLKGMHFQTGKSSQAKLITVLQGAIKDYFVDLRKNSPTFMDYGCTLLDDINNNVLFIPKGFAHGYITQSKRTIISYKLDAPYDPENEVTLLWSDPKININWPELSDLHISKKDMNGLKFSEIEAKL